MSIRDILYPGNPAHPDAALSILKKTVASMVWENPDFAPFGIWALTQAPRISTQADNMVPLPALKQLMATTDPAKRVLLADEVYLRYMKKEDRGMQPQDAPFNANLGDSYNKVWRDWFHNVGGTKHGDNWWRDLVAHAELGRRRLTGLFTKHGAAADFQAQDKWQDMTSAVFEAVPEAWITDKLDDMKMEGTEQTIAEHTLHLAPETWEEWLDTMRGRNEIRALLLLNHAQPAPAKPMFPTVRKIRWAQRAGGVFDVVVTQPKPGMLGPTLGFILQQHEGIEALRKADKLNKFLSQVAIYIMEAVQQIHAAGIGHHRLRAKDRQGFSSLRFVSGDLKKIWAGKTRLYLVDFSAARFYPTIDFNNRITKEEQLVPSMAWLPSITTCRSFPRTKPQEEEESKYPPPPELATDRPHDSNRDDSPSSMFAGGSAWKIMPEMGRKTDIWDAAMVIMEMYGLLPPQHPFGFSATDEGWRTEPVTDAHVEAWLADAVPAGPLRERLKLMLKVKPHMRSAAAPLAQGQFSSAGYDDGDGRVAGAWSDDDADEADDQWKQDLLLPCPDSLCHPVYADHQRLVAENRRLKAELRELAKWVRRAADRL